MAPGHRRPVPGRLDAGRGDTDGNGYEVVLSAPGPNEYAVWNTDLNGNYTSAATGVVSGTSPTLEAVEANLRTARPSPAAGRRRRQRRLRPMARRPGAGRQPVRAEPRRRGTGPLLGSMAALVTAGQFAATGAGRGGNRRQTGYEVAWGVPAGTSMWSGTPTPTATTPATPRGFCRAQARHWRRWKPTSARTSPARAARVAGTPASTTATGTNAATTLEVGSRVSNNQTVDFADLPSGGPSAVDLIDPTAS